MSLKIPERPIVTDDLKVVTSSLKSSPWAMSSIGTFPDIPLKKQIEIGLVQGTHLALNRVKVSPSRFKDDSLCDTTLAIRITINEANCRSERCVTVQGSHYIEAL
jgi:hypothetical protein